ncbi:MAG: hypothetical protein JXB05_31840 [Myxococcaceae bacterium]|nr:hypothetical protein [Myxococcaceae bacterium]
MSRALEVYEQIRTEIGPNTTKAVGRKLPDIVGLPPSIQTLEEAFGFIRVGYQMHHRGPGSIGSYHYEAMGERKGRMVCDNPYPCELDEGILEAVGEKFRPKDSLWVRVEHQPGSCRKNGDSACSYNIVW